MKDLLASKSQFWTQGPESQYSGGYTQKAVHY